VRLDGIPSISQGCGFVIFGKCFFEAGGTEIPETVMQAEDSASPFPLWLLFLQVFYKTHRLASRVLLIAARQGATDEQICDLLQGLPHLLDSASLQDIHAVKKKEGTDTTEAGNQPEVKETSNHTERMQYRSTTECGTVAPLGLLWLQSLHKTHRQASPLLLIAAREGATDEQICLALWPGLPHLTDPASLQDSFDMDWEDMFRRRCEFADNAKGTVVYDNACNTVCFAEYRDARVFDEYASNLIYQKNIRVRALENSVYDTFTGSAHFMDWEDMFRRRCDVADNAKGTVVYDNACNTVCFAEYRDARVALKNSLYDTFTGSAHFE
jgi:hypothetical protein